MSPRVEFSEENKVATGTNFNFPKLKLKKGEKARVLVGLETPLMEYAHNLRKPKIENGEPVYETVTRGSGENAKQVTVNVFSFVSNPLCTGDYSTLKDKGSDPDHCEMCKLAKDYPDYADAPKPRFAMHIVRYRTKANTFEPLTPFSVELLVWAFAGSTFNKIQEIKTEFNLKSHDLLLGPCEVENFQKFDINPAANAAWQAGEEQKRLVLETFRDNQIPDLSIACGTAKKPEWITQDINAIKEAWSEIKGSRSTAASEASLDDDLNNLMTKPKRDGATSQKQWADEAPAAVAADDPTADMSDDDLLGDLGSDAPAAEPEAAAPKEESKPAADFDDLLGDLGD